MFLTTVFILLISLVVLYSRVQQDLEYQTPYIYILGSIVALSTGFLLTSMYQRAFPITLLTTLFGLFVLVPLLLSSQRNRYVQQGRYSKAATLQYAIRFLVWAPLERLRLHVLQAASRVGKGETEEAAQQFERLREQQLPSSIEHALNQYHILLLGIQGNWSRVLRTYEYFEQPSSVCIPTLIHVAKAFVETDQFWKANEITSHLEQRSLTDEQQLGLETIRMAREMLQGNVQQGKKILSKICEEAEEIPPVFRPYWLGRGWAVAGHWQKALASFREAEERLVPNQKRWEEAIQREIEKIREKRDQQHVDVIRPEPDTSFETDPNAVDFHVPEAEEVVEEEPVTPGFSGRSEEIRQFIQKIKQIPYATVVMISILSLIWISSYAVQKVSSSMGPQPSQPSADVCRNAGTKTLILFGMKVDFLIDEMRRPPDYEARPISHELDLHCISSQFGVPLRTVAKGDDDGYFILTQNKQQHLVMWSYRPSVPEGRRATRLFGTDIHADSPTKFVREQGEVRWYAQSADGNWQGWRLTMENVTSIVPSTAQVEQLNDAYPSSMQSRGQDWRLLTATLLHVSFIHILFNCVALWVLGRIIENLYGIRDYLLIYLFSGLTGSLASWKFASHQLSAGASGAIFGLLGAALAVVYFHRESIPDRIRRRLGTTLLFWTALNLILGFSVAQIDNAGHIGGLIGGFVISYLVGPMSEDDLIQQEEGNSYYAVGRWGACIGLAVLYGYAVVEGMAFIYRHFSVITG